MKRKKEARGVVALLAGTLMVGCGGAEVPGASNDGSSGETDHTPDGPPVAPDASREAAVAPDASSPDGGPPDGGGAGLDGAVASRSAGCGRAATGTSRYERRTITIRGVDREYFLWVPRSYAPARAYPIIFRWHGSGGNGTSGGLEIEASAREDAIVVSPSGLAGQWSLDPSGPDVALFDTLLSQLGGELCLDGSRVFSYGFSAGAFLTNLLACVRPAVLRAVAPVEGGPSGAGCNGRVAAWITHGTADTSVSLARGTASRDRYLELDGCARTTLPDPPAPCVRYQGCASGYPVVWCQTDSRHDPQGRFTGPGAWNFFRSL